MPLALYKLSDLVNWVSALPWHVILLCHPLHWTKEKTLPFSSQKTLSTSLTKIRDLWEKIKFMYVYVCRSRKQTCNFSRQNIFMQRPQFVLHNRHLPVHTYENRKCSNLRVPRTWSTWRFYATPCYEYTYPSRKRYGPFFVTGPSALTIRSLRLPL